MKTPPWPGPSRAARVAPAARQALLLTSDHSIVAVSGTRRAVALPDVPTFEELSYTGLSANSWYSFFGPKDMPRAVAERFNLKQLARIAGAAGVVQW